MVIEIPAKDGAPATQVGFPKFEDRIILVRAADEQEAEAKGEEFAVDYGKRVPGWCAKSSTSKKYSTRNSEMGPRYIRHSLAASGPMSL